MMIQMVSLQEQEHKPPKHRIKLTLAGTKVMKHKQLSLSTKATTPDQPQ